MTSAALFGATCPTCVDSLLVSDDIAHDDGVSRGRCDVCGKTFRVAQIPMGVALGAAMSGQMTQAFAGLSAAGAAAGEAFSQAADAISNFGHTLTGVAPPSPSSGAATKAYVDKAARPRRRKKPEPAIVVDRPRAITLPPE